jgi:hypothetical protein
MNNETRHDSIHPSDRVQVEVMLPDGSKTYEAEFSGMHNLDEIVETVDTRLRPEINPELCVFMIRNLSSGVEKRYRLNAHGNLHLIA